MVNLRAIFDKYRVEYRDHGPNTSRGHINIKCPWCGNDPSHHMGINESTGEYFCFRNPRHAGHNLPGLFRRLGLPKSTWEGLKVDLTAGTRQLEDSKDYTLWRYFTSANENQEALDYLRDRLFLDPEKSAQKFQLKAALQGEWCGRLLIPLTIGWTGRAIRSHIEPRYKAYTSEDGFYFFSHNASSAIIVEGAIDAMRIASVSTQFDVYGKCRIQISSSMILQIMSKNYQSIYSSPDNTVPYSQQREELVQLRSYCTRSFVGQIKTFEKDFGASTESECRKILSSIPSLIL